MNGRSAYTTQLVVPGAVASTSIAGALVTIAAALGDQRVPAPVRHTQRAVAAGRAVALIHAALNSTTVKRHAPRFGIDAWAWHSAKDYRERRTALLRIAADMAARRDGVLQHMNAIMPLPIELQRLCLAYLPRTWN